MREGNWLCLVSVLRFSRWYLIVRCLSSVSPRYFVLQVIFIFCPLFQCTVTIRIQDYCVGNDAVWLLFSESIMVCKGDWQIEIIFSRRYQYHAHILWMHNTICMHVYVHGPNHTRNLWRPGQKKNSGCNWIAKSGRKKYSVYILDLWIFCMTAVDGETLFFYLYNGQNL